MTSKVRISQLNGNASVGVVVKNGTVTVEQAILQGKGDEIEVTVYPGIILVIGELARVEELVANEGAQGVNPFVPEVAGARVVDEWDEPNDEDNEDK